VQVFVACTLSSRNLRLYLEPSLFSHLTKRVYYSNSSNGMAKRFFFFNRSNGMATFFSNFDHECKVYVESLIRKSPIELRKTEEFGNGLYAKKDIRKGNMILQEKPIISTSQSSKFSKALVVARNVENVEWEVDSFLVAAAVEIAINSNEWPMVPSNHTPFRCLGYTRNPTADDDFVLTTLHAHVSKVFDLGRYHDSIWTPEECLKIYDKVKSNYFQSNVLTSDIFVAASMLNHSCLPNAVFTSIDKLSANQNIKAGEQIFVSYDVANPKVDLPELYGFKCNCPKCKANASGFF